MSFLPPSTACLAIIRAVEPVEQLLFTCNSNPFTMNKLLSAIRANVYNNHTNYYFKSLH